ncbi:hypothetical protein E7T06_18320 [Deinococcus sp. Arct2-2]|nr:hypothetical protein E7T06_18320 [Deinococcus sp. Arct2-2]
MKVLLTDHARLGRRCGDRANMSTNDQTRRSRFLAADTTFIPLGRAKIPFQCIVRSAQTRHAVTVEKPGLLSRQHLDEVRQRTRDLRQTLLLTFHVDENALKLLLDDVRLVLTGILEKLCHTGLN